jgi:hypothetical protein
MSSACGTYEREESYIRVLVGKPEGKRLLERPRIRWECKFKMCHQEVGCGLDWIDLSQDKGRWWALWSAIKPTLSTKMCGIS